MTATIDPTAAHRIHHGIELRRRVHVFRLLMDLARAADPAGDLSDAELHETALDVAAGYSPGEWEALGADQSTAGHVLAALRALVALDSPVPAVVTAHFGDGVVPTAHEVYTYQNSWQPIPGAQPFTVAFAQRMARQGVERLSARVGDRVADFGIRELTR